MSANDVIDMVECNSATLHEVFVGGVLPVKAVTKIPIL